MQVKVSLKAPPGLPYGGSKWTSYTYVVCTASLRGLITIVRISLYIAKFHTPWCSFRVSFPLLVATMTLGSTFGYCCETNTRENKLITPPVLTTTLPPSFTSVVVKMYLHKPNSTPFCRKQHCISSEHTHTHTT